MCNDGSIPTCEDKNAPSKCADSSTPAGKPPKCTDGKLATCSNDLRPLTCPDGSSPSSEKTVEKVIVDGETG
jgi:hypothetical protein